MAGGYPQVSKPVHKQNVFLSPTCFKIFLFVIVYCLDVFWPYSESTSFIDVYGLCSN